MSSELSLRIDAFGQLLLKTDDSEETVTPVRAFPFSAADQGVALIGADGHEKRWIENLAELPDKARQAIEQTLAPREFRPRIQCIESVSTFATPSEWQVMTDRGPTSLTLRGEEDIRRLGQGALLIMDAQGLQFIIDNVAALDRASKRLLDRFL